jgi:type VI secretion system secreted protein VgrG
MTDSNGALVWDALYRPFGEAHSITGTADNRQRFPGQLYDAETSFHYNYFRDYDPSLGRYVQSDPIGLDGGINTYAYVEGNPLVFIDQWGQVKHSPDSEYCRSLKKKIDNIRNDIRRRDEEIAGNPGTLPEFGPGPNRSTRQGHRRIVNKLWNNLRRLEKQYDKECGGGGGNAGAPVAGAAAGDGANCGDNCQKTAMLVMGVGGAYIVYRCIRMVPSLFPPLWPTIPLNVATP